MKPKRTSSISEERFQRATEDIIELVMEETRQELIPRLRKDNAEKLLKEVKKKAAPVAVDR
jgi:hypothetical protein